VPGLSILDGYVAAMYLRIMALSGIAMAGIFYISTFIDLSDKVFRGKATWAMMGGYLWYATPQYVYYLIPLSVLLASLVTVSVLAKNSELTVLKACGVSLYRFALPMIVCAVVAGGTLFAIDQSILGPSNRRAESIRAVMRGLPGSAPDAFSRQWAISPDGRTIYHYNYFDARQRQLLRLEVYDIDPDMHRLTRRTSADRAIDIGAQAGSQVQWRLENGWTREFDDQGEPRTFAPFLSTQKPLETPAYFGADAPDARFMSYTQLRTYTQRLQQSGLDVLEQQVALARKVSFPFITLIMTLIAVPFAVTIGRSGAMAGIGVGIGLAITYWTAISVFAALGAGGLIAPMLAAWATNLLFGAGAGYLLLTVRT
jgi:LPS export ABC transporter permease LptG